MKCCLLCTDIVLVVQFDEEHGDFVAVDRVRAVGEYRLYGQRFAAFHVVGTIVAVLVQFVQHAGEVFRIGAGFVLFEDEENQCENYDTCATIEFWEGLYKVVNEYLDGTTLYDLVEIQKEKMGGNYYI